MQTAELLDQAGEYAKLAVLHLSLTNWKRDEELEDAAQRYRLHFLFPDMDTAARLELQGILQLRRALLFSYGTLKNHLANLPDSKEFEAETSKRETMYADLLRSFKDEHMASLTPTQAQILDTLVDLFPQEN